MVCGAGNEVDMSSGLSWSLFFFFQAEDGIRDHCVTGVQTCALPIYKPAVMASEPIGEMQFVGGFMNLVLRIAL